MATVTLATLQNMRKELVNSKYYLNIRSGYMAPVTLHCSYGDSGETVTFYIFDGGDELDLTGAVVSVHGTRRDGANFGPFSCTVDSNSVSFELQSTMTAVEGGGIAEFTITKNSSTIGTCNFGIMVEDAVFPNGVAYDSDPSVYQDILAYIQEMTATSTYELRTSFTSALAAEASARASADATNASNINTQKGRIDNLITAGVEDGELIDIRTKYDGTTATSAGNAVREQFATVYEIADDANKTANGATYIKRNSGNSLDIRDLNIRKGTKVGIIVNKISGSYGEIIVYANGSAEANLITYFRGHQSVTFIAPEDITYLHLYITGYNAAVIDFTVKLVGLDNEIYGEEYESTNATGTQDIEFPNLSINPGDIVYISTTLISGSSANLILYKNTRADNDVILYIGNNSYATFVATETITRLSLYISGFNNASIKAHIKTRGFIGETVGEPVYGVNASGNNLIDIQGLSIHKGDVFVVKLNLFRGKATAGLVMKHNSSSANQIGEIIIDGQMEFCADEDINKLTVYLTEFNAGVVRACVTTRSTVSRVEKLESLIPTELPPFSISRVRDMIIRLRGVTSSKSVSIAFLTDIHCAGYYDQDKTQRAINRSIAAINNINSVCPLEFVMFNGDYIYNGVNDTRNRCISWYRKLSESVNGLQPKLFIGKGNHDVNDIVPSSGEYITDERLYNEFLNKTTLDYKSDYGYVEKAYGYYDDPHRRIRFIFINTHDTPFVLEDGAVKYPQMGYGLSNRQLNFIADALKFTETDWGVVVFSHMPLFPDGTGYHYPDDRGGTQLRAILNAFKNKTSYTNSETSDFATYSISVDYSSNASSEVIALINGHTHEDRVTVVDGYTEISTVAASYIYGSYDSDHNQVSRTPDTMTETSWDIITFNRGDRTIYLTRYGWGEDRTVTY